MKSKAPIFPPPPKEVGNGHRNEPAPIVNAAVSDNVSPHSVPMSSGSPYHVHCVPRPPTIPHSKPTHNTSRRLRRLLYQLLSPHIRM